MNHLINKYGIIFFCIISFIIFLGIPIPCEIIMTLFGGYLYKHNYSLIYIIIINMISLLGSLILYIIGKRINIKKIKSKKILEALEFYNKYQNISVLIGRFIPVVRIYISLVSGMNKQNILKFIIYSCIGIFIYNSFLIILGYQFTNNLSYIINIIDKTKDIIITFIIVIIILLISKSKICKK